MTRGPLVPFAQVVHAFSAQGIGTLLAGDKADQLVEIVSYIDVLRDAEAS